MAVVTCATCNNQFSLAGGQQSACPKCGHMFRWQEPGPSRITLAAPPLGAAPPATVMPSRATATVQALPASTNGHPVIAPQSQAANPERTSLIAKVAWAVFLPLVGLVFLFHLLMQFGSKDITAIQQAAIAAETCVWLIMGYVVCRAIESLCRS